MSKRNYCNDFSWADPSESILPFSTCIFFFSFHDSFLYEFDQVSSSTTYFLYIARLGNACLPVYKYARSIFFCICYAVMIEFRWVDSPICVLDSSFDSTVIYLTNTSENLEFFINSRHSNDSYTFFFFCCNARTTEFTEILSKIERLSRKMQRTKDSPLSRVSALFLTRKAMQPRRERSLLYVN